MSDLRRESQKYTVKIKISATYEGKCDVCKKKKLVFTAGDEETHKAATVCKECSESMGSESVSEVIEKFGKKDDKVFDSGVRYERKPSAG